MTTIQIRPGKRFKPRAKPVKVEAGDQKAIVEWARLVLPIGSLVWAVINEIPGSAEDPYQRARFGQKLKAFGLTSGIPDVHMLITGHGYKVMEIKRHDGKGVVSSVQQDIHDVFRARGVPVGVCVDIESARAFLQSEGVPLSEAAGQLARHAVVRNAARRDSLNDGLPF